MDDMRGNPDDILRRIKGEEINESRGHLKIFFGYAAGVGKTYAMLKAARSAQHRGTDVVVGYVEPHTRPRTMELLEGLEVLPKRDIEHKGIILHEFDLDGAIERNPQIIIVDELAHTNADGCRHFKRFQDIEELLSAGIDVYTTVNVQHIESLNDIVASITGVVVKERIPDHVFDNADQVYLVDIEPEELIERLNNGKIYGESQARKALGNFFGIENLVALREIALRRTADRINKMSEKVKQTAGSDYYTDEHILVCLSSSPTNAKIIRAAARMADAFKGELIALFVETADFDLMSDEDRRRLRDNIHLAQQLGATVETSYGDNIPLQISEFARLSGVSKVVMGRSGEIRKRFFMRPTMSEQLVEYSPNLDIYIIPDNNQTPYRRPGRRKISSKGYMGDIAKSLLILVAATMIGTIFYNLHFGESNIITIYILGVLVASVATSQRAYSLVLSIVSVFTFNFFFTEPRFTFHAYNSGYPVTFAVMFIAALITGSLAGKIKQHAKQSAQTAYRTKILLETNQLLAKEREMGGIISVTSNQLVKLLKKPIVFYGGDGDCIGEPIIFFPTEDRSGEEDILTENERGVATWVFKNNKHAGASTNTLGDAKCLYLAVRTVNRVYGVIGVVADETPIDSFENSIVLSILGECGLAMERDIAVRERQEVATLAKNEQLRANLLRCISHDLRTPLTSISGNAGVLMASESSIDTAKRHKLYEDIYDDSIWLINLVENLLSVTRIEDGTMNIKMTAELMGDVVEEALRHISKNRLDHNITVHMDDEFILVPMDSRLIVQVIINIVNNGIKYTPHGSDIDIHIYRQGAMAVVDISDMGDGIPDEAKERIFDMFYTVGAKVADSRRSIGLGLALCKSIINAHKGEISVVDNKPKGAIFRFTLPAKEVVIDE